MQPKKETLVGNNIQISLRNLNSKVEREVAMNYGNEEQVLGDDEMTNSAGTDREEAPCDGDVVTPSVVTFKSWDSKCYSEAETL
jgi:hypothetical protein